MTNIIYRVGDKVKFLNDVGGGTVTKIAGKTMVHVENEDGFEIPTLISEIVLVGEKAEPTKGSQKPTITDFVKQANQIVEQRESSALPKVTVEKGKDQPNFHFAFVPENSQNALDGSVDAYLVNDSNYTLMYSYLHLDGMGYSIQKYGTILPNTKELVDRLSSIDISKIPEFAIQMVFFKEGMTSLPAPLHKTIRINSVKFYKQGSFKPSIYFKKLAMLVKLNESDFEVAVKKLTQKDVELAEIQPERKKQKNKSPELVEVDLHIHELIDDETGLSPKDMLDLQMKTFNERMKEFEQDKQIKRAVFVHGLGNGVLKSEIRQELNRKYKKYDCQDASFQEYGYGATMVILRR